MLDLLPFFFSPFQYINTMRGEMTIGDRRKCCFFLSFFLLMFLMRGKMKLGAAGSLMGNEHRGHLSYCLWHFPHLTCLKQSQPHPRSPLCFAVSPSPRRYPPPVAVIFQWQTTNFVRCQFGPTYLSAAFAFSRKLSRVESPWEGVIEDVSQESHMRDRFKKKEKKEVWCRAPHGTPQRLCLGVRRGDLAGQPSVVTLKRPGCRLNFDVSFGPDFHKITQEM